MIVNMLHRRLGSCIRVVPLFASLGFSLMIFSCTGRSMTPEDRTPEIATQGPNQLSIESETLEPLRTKKLPATASPTPLPSPTTCAEATGKGVDSTYSGVEIQMEIPLVLYLPPCYESTSKTYPVIYLLHGYPYNQTHWMELGIINAADQAIARGTEPFMMVMPLQPEPLFRKSDGGPGSYESELIEGLVPYIDRTYRTIDLPESRSLSGISRGGIWALEIGLRNPDLFNQIAAFSPSLSVNYARPPYDPMVIAAESEHLPSDVFLLAGDADWALAKTEELYEILYARGDLEDLRLQVVPGAHSDPTWESSIELLFEFLTLQSGE